MTYETDKIKFDSQIKKPCIVDFFATGCPSCEKLAPVFEEVSEQHREFTFLKVNLDEDITLAERYGIDHIPTVILFDKGEIIKMNTGYMDNVEFNQFIESGGQR